MFSRTYFAWEMFENAELHDEHSQNKHFQSVMREIIGSPIDNISDNKFVQLYRLDKEAYMWLCSFLRQHTSLKSTQRVSLETKVLCSLLFYANGDYQRVVGEANHFSQEAMILYIEEVTAALNTPAIVNNIIQFPKTRHARDIIKQSFYSKSGIPGVIGCIDGSHFKIFKPNFEEEHLYYCRKGYHSLNVQMVCDANCKILSVNAKFGGPTHDAFIWENSYINTYLQSLHAQHEIVWLLGDSGYPQRPWLMTPYADASPDSIEDNYNKKHSSTRVLIENTFGRLKNRWRCLCKDRVLHYKPSKCARIIIACCVLHNVAMQHNVPDPEPIQDLATEPSVTDMDTYENEVQEEYEVQDALHNELLMGRALRDGVARRLPQSYINVQGLSHKTPTDDDISNVLKEFTVDFLLKGYNSLVHTLHNQILSNLHLEIDTSHFFWLVTYFLKFATQIELDLENLHSVLSFDILSYLTAEGVNLCEQFELAIKLDGNDLKPSLRRLHLVVTAIREFVQAIEVYKKFNNSSEENEEALSKLQLQMCETEELRSLLVLLLRHYNPKYHTKQYLQDLIVTNHILLLLVDNVMRTNEYDNSTYMIEHIRQFANPEIMYQYGLLLEDYTSNGEFVNDCIFTIMHHVGGLLESLISLFQPKILKTFTSIWKSEYEICDDWSDLIEYVINTFVKKPRTIETKTSFCLVAESFEPSEPASPHPAPAAPAAASATPPPSDAPPPPTQTSTPTGTTERWSNDELSSLSWHFMQSQASRDAIGEIMRIYRDDGISKTRESVISELFKQNLISRKESENFLKLGNERSAKSSQASRDIREDEMAKLCELLIQDGKSKYLDWVQKVLLDTCLAKICLENKSATEHNIFKLDQTKPKGVTVVSPVSYHSLLLNQSVPLVPWNCEQAAMCKDLKFLQLLHKLGFHMPVDSGKVFIRIPHFWTAEMLYELAGKICAILSQIKINLSMNDFSDSSPANPQINISLLAELKKDVNLIASPENFYQIQKQNHLATMVNFTPMPGSSFVSENEEINAEATTNWLDLVHKAQENDSYQNVESVCETASVNSDLTRMYVSDEDDKTEILLPPRILDVNTILEELKYSNADDNASKRPRVYFPPV